MLSRRVEPQHACRPGERKWSTEHLSPADGQSMDPPRLAEPCDRHATSLQRKLAQQGLLTVRMNRRGVWGLGIGHLEGSEATVPEDTRVASAGEVEIHEIRNERSGACEPREDQSCDVAVHVGLARARGLVLCEHGHWRAGSTAELGERLRPAPGGHAGPTPFVDQGLQPDVEAEAPVESLLFHVPDTCEEARCSRAGCSELVSGSRIGSREQHR